MSDQTIKSSVFLKKLVKKMLSEQESSYIDSDGAPMLSPDDPSGLGIDPIALKRTNSPIPLEVRDKESFSQALKDACGEDNFGPAIQDMSEKYFSPECLFLRAKLAAGGFDGTIKSLKSFSLGNAEANQLAVYVAYMRGVDEDDFETPKKHYESEVNIAIEEYIKLKLKIGSGIAKQIEQANKDRESHEKTGAMAYFYQLFTEDAQEFVRDAYRASDRSDFDNNIQLATVRLNKRNTEGVGGTDLERVRSHMVLYSKHSYASQDDFSKKFASNYGDGIEKFVPASWDPKFYRIHEDILEFIVDFIVDQEAVLITGLKAARSTGDDGIINTNLGKVQNTYKKMHQRFKMGLEHVIMDITRGYAAKGVHAAPQSVLGFEIFKNENYINNLIKNMSRIFYLGKDGWDWPATMRLGESNDSSKDLKQTTLLESVYNEITSTRFEQRGLHGGSSAFGTPSTSMPGSNRIYRAAKKTTVQRKKEKLAGKRKAFVQMMNPYGVEKLNGRWSPLVLFLLTMKGLDFFTGKQKSAPSATGDREWVQVEGSNSRDWAMDRQSGSIFSGRSRRRRNAMIEFINDWADRKPSEFFNDYYIDKNFIPSLLDNSDLNNDGMPDKKGLLVNWVAFQRAAIYDPTSEIAQNANRDWGAYGNQKIVNKKGKKIEIPKGYAYFYEWSKDTFDLFEKKQLVDKIADHNTNMTLGIIYGAAEWSLAFRAATSVFAATEGILQNIANTQLSLAMRPAIAGQSSAAVGRHAALARVANVAKMPVAALRHLSLISRTGAIVGLLVATFVIIDYWGWYDIKDKFKERYSKIKNIVCDLKTLMDNQSADNSNQGNIKDELIRIYENLIVAYRDLVKLYTSVINDAGGQGASRRDMIFYERFRIIERMQYFQKYEITLQNGFKRALKDINEMKDDKTVGGFLESLKNNGFDAAEQCRILESQVTQLSTRAKRDENEEFISTGAPPSLTGFPTWKDLQGFQSKSKDELQATFDTLQSNADVAHIEAPIRYTTFKDGGKNLNRDLDPAAVWIMKGVKFVDDLVKPPEYEPEKPVPTELDENTFLVENNIKWKGLDKTLNTYYGPTFDSETGLAKLKVIIERAQLGPVAYKSENKEKTHSSAAAEHSRYSTSRKLQDFKDYKFIANSTGAKTILDSIKLAHDKRAIISGIKTDEFLNQSKLFGSSEGKIFHTSQWMSKEHINSQSRKYFTALPVYSSYSNYQALGDMPEEVFAMHSSPLPVILRASKMGGGDKILQGETIDLDLVWKMFSAGRKKVNDAQTWLSYGLESSLNPVTRESLLRKIPNLRASFQGDARVIYEMASIDNTKIELAISSMEKKLASMDRILRPVDAQQGIPGVGSAENRGVAAKKKIADKFRFHITLMKFLYYSVKITLVRDLRLTVNIHNKLHDGGYNTNTDSLEEDLQTKMRYFIQLGEISDMFDQAFDDSPGLDFRKITKMSI
jgi:hypothetical protein